MRHVTTKPAGYAEWPEEIRRAFDSGYGRKTVLDFIMRHAGTEELRLHAGDALLAAMVQEQDHRTASSRN